MWTISRTRWKIQMPMTCVRIWYLLPHPPLTHTQIQNSSRKDFHDLDYCHVRSPWGKRWCCFRKNYQPSLMAKVVVSSKKLLLSRKREDVAYYIEVNTYCKCWLGWGVLQWSVCGDRHADPPLLCSGLYHLLENPEVWGLHRQMSSLLGCSSQHSKSSEQQA